MQVIAFRRPGTHGWLTVIFVVSSHVTCFPCAGTVELVRRINLSSNPEIHCSDLTLTIKAIHCSLPLLVCSELDEPTKRVNVLFLVNGGDDTTVHEV